MRHGHHHTPCRPSQELGCPSPDSLGVRPATSESPNPPKNPSRSSTETARIGQQSASVPVRTEPAPNTIAGRRRTRPSSATDRESASTVVSPRNVEQTGVVPSVPMEPPPSVPKGRQVEPTFGDAAYQFAKKGVVGKTSLRKGRRRRTSRELPEQRRGLSRSPRLSCTCRSGIPVTAVAGQTRALVTKDNAVCSAAQRNHMEHLKRAAIGPMLCNWNGIPFHAFRNL